MRIKFLSFVSTLLVTALIFGCSSGGSSSSTSATSTTASSGTISDPYIYNALFDEYDAEGTLLQSTLEPSDLKGSFTFSAPLTVGSTITMRTTASVMHATPKGALSPYDGPILTRRVSQELVTAVANGEKAIVTPLTTYAAQLQKAAEVAGAPISEADAIASIVEMIDKSGNSGLVTADTLFNDPMTAFEAGGNNDPSLLQASMAINIALKAADDDFESTLDNALVLVKKILPKNADGSAPSEGQFVAANTIVGIVSRSETPAATANTFGDKVEAIITDANDLQDGEILVVSDDGGTIEKKNYQALFTTEFEAAIDSLEGVLTGDFDETNADPIACAKKFSKAKSTLELANETGATVTVTQKDKDTLNFFYAFSRVVLLANPLTDSNPDNGLQRLSDVLDALHDPDTTLSGSDLQQFIYQRAGAELLNAIAALDEVSVGFDLALTYDGTDTEFDHTDVLYLKAIGHAALFQANLLQGLNLNADIKAIASSEGKTVQKVMDDHPELLTTKDTEALASAKAFAILAVNGMKEAIAAMEDEIDAQDDDFINFYEVDALEQDAMIAEAIADLNKVLELLNGPTDVTSGDQTITVDLTKFFAGTTELNNLLPTFTGDTPGMFPDPTLDGILSTDIGLNVDRYQDGIPDIIQEELVKFTESMLWGKSFLIELQYRQELIEFAAEPQQTFTMALQDLSGTWELIEGGDKIELTYTTMNGDSTDTISFDIGRQDEGFLEFDITWTAGDDSAPARALELNQITAFTTEMLTNKTMVSSSHDLEFFFEFLDNGTYGGAIESARLFGTWEVINDQLILTPDVNCTDCSGIDTWILEKGYSHPYFAGPTLFVTINDNLEILTLFDGIQ